MTTPKERAAKAFEYALGYYNMHDDAPTLVEIEEAADKVLAAIAEPSDAMIEAIKSANIINFDQHFGEIFNINENNKLTLKSVLNIKTEFLEGMEVSNKKSYILFYNTKINNDVRYPYNYTL